MRVLLLSIVLLPALLLGCARVGEPCNPDLVPCGLGEFCRFPEGSCGQGLGVCAEIPDACTLEFAPVCGCDGMTYGNACEADAAAVSIAHDGPCDDQGEICNGIAGLICDAGQFCRFEEGVCGRGDQTGVCEALPDFCTDVFDPVCACDGQTYGNECEAAAAGVSVDFQGACEQELCCNPADQPGFGGTPPCFEGSSCCADGTWQCNQGDGSSTCDQPGQVCDQETGDVTASRRQGWELGSAPGVGKQ